MTVLDYSSVTEKAGDWVTQEALSMVYTRYRYAAEFCRDKRLLEVAAARVSGWSTSRSMRGIPWEEISRRNCSREHVRGQGKIPLLVLGAEALPLRMASRDVIVC